MRYGEFRAQHDSVMQACLTAQLDADGLVAEIRALADSVTDPDEQHGILRLTEPLAMQIAALESSATPDQR